MRAHLNACELDSHAHTRDIVRVLRRRQCLDEVAHAELLGWRLRLNRFARAVDHRFLAPSNTHPMLSLVFSKSSRPCARFHDHEGEVNRIGLIRIAALRCLHQRGPERENSNLTCTLDCESNCSVTTISTCVRNPYYYTLNASTF